MATLERRFRIVNKLGLHARAAAKLVQAANRYGSEIHLCREDQEVNGKSIMGVLMLAASQGTEIVVKVSGDDAEEALATLAALIEDGFGEDRG